MNIQHSYANFFSFATNRANRMSMTQPEYSRGTFHDIKSFSEKLGYKNQGMTQLGDEIRPCALAGTEAANLTSLGSDFLFLLSNIAPAETQG